EGYMLYIYITYNKHALCFALGEGAIQELYHIPSISLEGYRYPLSFNFGNWRNLKQYPSKRFNSWISLIYWIFLLLFADCLYSRNEIKMKLLHPREENG